MRPLRLLSCTLTLAGGLLVAAIGLANPCMLPDNGAGTVDLTGFARTLAVPVSCEIHTGPRTPGDPVQTFDAVLYDLQGQIFGDPDFCDFRVVAGSGNASPQDGHHQVAGASPG